MDTKIQKMLSEKERRENLRRYNIEKEILEKTKELAKKANEFIKKLRETGF